MLENLRQLLRKDDEDQMDEEATLSAFDERQELLDARIAALKIIADTVARNE